jgi:hypothetical protein
MFTGTGLPLFLQFSSFWVITTVMPVVQKMALGMVHAFKKFWEAICHSDVSWYQLMSL